MHIQREIKRVRSFSALATMMLHFIGSTLAFWITLYPITLLSLPFEGLIPRPAFTVTCASAIVGGIFCLRFLVDAYCQIRYRFFPPADGLTVEQRNLLNNGSKSSVASKVVTPSSSRWQRPTPRKNENPWSNRRLPRTPGGYQQPPQTPRTPTAWSGFTGSPLNISHVKSPSSAGRVADHDATSDLVEKWKAERVIQREKGTFELENHSFAHRLGSVMDQDRDDDDFESSYFHANRVPDPHKAVQDRDGWNSLDAYAVYQDKLAIRSDGGPGLIDHIHKSEEACRRWLANVVLRHVLDVLAHAKDFLKSQELLEICLYCLNYQPRKTYDIVEDKTEIMDHIVHPFMARLQQQPQMMEEFFNQRGLILKKFARHMEDIKLSYKYLALHENLKYLVQRIQSLHEDRCLHEYQFDGGERSSSGWGSHRYMRNMDEKSTIQWTEDCPTDAQILIHCFCSYMDEKTYSNSVRDNRDSNGLHYGSLRIDFSHLHFIKNKDIYRLTDKRQDIVRSDLYIYQSSTRPPEFQILKQVSSPQTKGEYGEESTSLDKWEKWQLQKGSSNLFHAIVIFLYLICDERGGYFAEANVSLSRSGLDIAQQLRFDSLSRIRTLISN